MRDGSRGGSLGRPSSLIFVASAVLSGSRVPLRLRCIVPHNEPRPIFVLRGGAWMVGCLSAAIPFGPSCFCSIPLTPGFPCPLGVTMGGSSQIFSTILVRTNAHREQVERSLARHQPEVHSGYIAWRGGVLCCCDMGSETGRPDDVASSRNMYSCEGGSALGVPN